MEIKEHLEFAKNVDKLLQEATDNFYGDSLTARAHYKLGILAQYVSGAIQQAEDELKLNDI